MRRRRLRRSGTAAARHRARRRSWRRSPSRPADQRDRAQRAQRQAVAGGDHRQRAQRRRGVLGADADDDVALVERRAQHLQQRRPGPRASHQLVDLRQVLEAVLGQQPRGAVDVQRVLGGRGELGEGWPRRSRNVRSVCPSDGSASRACSLRAPRPRPDELLVEVLRRPRDEAASTGARTSACAWRRRRSR